MKKFLFIIFFFSSLFGLDDTQVGIIKEVYNTCKQYKASDGFSFENTCAAIVLKESSAGEHLIGDQGKYPEILANSSLGVMQVRVKTVLYVFAKFPDLRQRYSGFWHGDIDAIDKYIPILASVNYFRYKWIQAVKARDKKKIEKYRKIYMRYRDKFSKYRYVYFKDLKIADALLTDIKFNVMIAAHYLILNYETAKKRHYWNPWWKAVSRYNGGWYNSKYVIGVIRKMRIVRKLRKKGYLK